METEKARASRLIIAGPGLYRKSNMEGSRATSSSEIRCATIPKVMSSTTTTKILRQMPRQRKRIHSLRSHSKVRDLVHPAYTDRAREHEWLIVSRRLFSDFMCPLKHPSELPTHPSMSHAYTSKAMLHMTQAIEAKLRQESGAIVNCGVGQCATQDGRLEIRMGDKISDCLVHELRVDVGL